MSSLLRFVRLWVLPAFGLCLISCETTKTQADDPYASNYGSDGGYNPYPGQSGYVQGGGGGYQAPKYEAPPAPVPAEPNAYAFEPPAPAPRPSAASKKSTATSSKPKSSATAKKATGGSHTVVKGDTLYGIARKKGSTVAKIKSANGLSSDLIRIGQKLKIP